MLCNLSPAELMQANTEIKSCVKHCMSSAMEDGKSNPFS